MKLQDDISFRNTIDAKFQSPKFTIRAITKQYMNIFKFFTKYSIHHLLSADTIFKFLLLILFEILDLQKALILHGEIIQKKKYLLFSMRHPYMKFQDDISMPNTYIIMLGDITACV